MAALDSSCVLTPCGPFIIILWPSKPFPRDKACNSPFQEPGAHSGTQGSLTSSISRLPKDPQDNPLVSYLESFNTSLPISIHLLFHDSVKSFKYCFEKVHLIFLVFCIPSLRGCPIGRHPHHPPLPHSFLFSMHIHQILPGTSPTHVKQQSRLKTSSTQLESPGLQHNTPGRGCIPLLSPSLPVSVKRQGASAVKAGVLPVGLQSLGSLSAVVSMLHF